MEGDIQGGSRGFHQKQPIQVMDYSEGRASSFPLLWIQVDFGDQITAPCFVVENHHVGVESPLVAENLSMMLFRVRANSKSQ